MLSLNYLLRILFHYLILSWCQSFLKTLRNFSRLFCWSTRKYQLLQKLPGEWIPAQKDIHTISNISCLVYHEFYFRHSLSSFSTSVNAVFRSSVIWSALQVYPSVIDSVRRPDSQLDILSVCSSVSQSDNSTVSSQAFQLPSPCHIDSESYQGFFYDRTRT